MVTRWRIPSSIVVPFVVSGTRTWTDSGWRLCWSGICEGFARQARVHDKHVCIYVCMIGHMWTISLICMCIRTRCFTDIHMYMSYVHIHMYSCYHHITPYICTYLQPTSRCASNLQNGKNNAFYTETNHPPFLGKILNNIVRRSNIWFCT